MSTETKNVKLKLNNILYYMTAFLMPSILLFYLYNSNRAQNTLFFSQILILAALFAVIGLLVYIIFKIIIKSEEGALLLSVAFWLCFWFFRTLYGLALRYVPTMSSLIFFALICAGLILIAVYIRFNMLPFEKVRPGFIALSMSLILLFVFNLIPGVSFNVTLSRARNERLEAERTGTEDTQLLLFKKDFIVDYSLPKPDIYWLHMDGMMSLETFEHYWDVPQDYVREALVQRGFVINENASLNAGVTNAALPALLSPMFYDTFFSERINRMDGELRNARSEYYTEELARVGLTYDDASNNYELIKALADAEYSISFIRDHAKYSPLIQEQGPNLRYFFGRWHSDTFGALPKLLAMTTPIDIRPTYLRDESRTSLIEDRVRKQHFTLRMFTDTHLLRLYEQDSDLTYVHEGYYTPHLYPAAYEKAVKNMLACIDNVLENNPNTVIVIQADHGFHIEAAQRYLLDTGYSLEQVLEMIHSVISAVRIPDAYGGLETPIAPLNISRELVNRFVGGENYVLLDD